jgi:hypothetical protein
MNCEKAKKLIPLLAGRELSAKKDLRLKKHIQTCASCQKELKEYKTALTRIRSLAQKEEAKDWSENEWKALMKKAVSEEMEPKTFPFKINPKLAFAYGFALLAILILAGILIKYFVLKPKSITPLAKPTIVKKIESPKIPPIPPQQEKTPEVIKPEQPLVVAKVQKPVAPPVQRAQTESELNEQKPQDVVSVTLISKDTGLKVIWFFDKNFEWKGEEK